MDMYWTIWFFVIGLCLWFEGAPAFLLVGLVEKQRAHVDISRELDAYNLQWFQNPSSTWTLYVPI